MTKAESARKSTQASRGKVTEGGEATMRVRSSSLKLVLALDSFLSPTAGVKNSLRTVAAFARHNGMKVQPMSVISPDQLKWPREFAPEWRQEFTQLGTEALARLLTRLKFSAELPSDVVLQFTHSTRVSAHVVADYAKSAQASVLCVLTHVRKKPLAAFPGGLAESLISYSSVPVLAVNAAAPAVDNFKSILFPTDFSDGSEAIFSQAVEIAARISARLTLFHAMPSPLDQNWIAGASMVGGWERLEAFFEQEESRSRKIADRWMDTARGKGIKCQFDFVHSKAGLSDSILKASLRNKSDLVIMQPQTGPIASYFMGSALRDVLRKSRKPVLIIRS